jgi:hypothetical protein
MTACPSDTITPAQGDFRLLTRLTVNKGPGIITPDKEVMTTVPNAASIRLLQIKTAFPIIAFKSDFYPAQLELAFLLHYTKVKGDLIQCHWT